MFSRRIMPSRDCRIVSRTSCRCMPSRGTAINWPALRLYTVGIMAASTVHWLMLEDTMFMRAMGAWRMVEAHLKAETFSGNSERNGATHWMKTNSLMPAVRASFFFNDTATTEIYTLSLHDALPI